MCEPATIAYLAVAAVSAYSANEQGKSAKKTADYNAREQENEAVRTRNRGVEAENAHRQKVAELQSRQRAQLGAANVDLNTGSALQIQEDASLMGEVDSLRIRTNFSEQASSMDRGAVLTSAQGDAAKSAGQMKAAGSLLSSAGQVSSKWYNPKSAATADAIL